MLGEASVWGLQSNLLKFRSEFSVQIESTNPDDVGPVLPIRPDYRPDVHEPSGLRDSAFAPSGGNIVLHDDLVSADD